MTVKKIRELIVFTVLVFVGIWKFDVVVAALRFIWGILLPFVVGGGIAFVGKVLMNFIERHLFYKHGQPRFRKGKKLIRPLSLILTLVTIFGMILLLLFIVVPQLAQTIMTLGENINNAIPRFQEWIQELSHNNQYVMEIVNQIDINSEKIVEWAMSFVQNGVGSFMNTTFIAVKSTVNAVIMIFVALVFACYVLIQKETLQVQIRKVAYAFLKKEWVEKIFKVLTLTNKTFTSFLTGQCVEALAFGSLITVSMTIFQLPYAPLIGVMLAFLTLIPVFGAFVGCATGMLLIVTVSPPQALGFLILFLVMQQIDGNFIYPHIVGNAVGLPSIWVLAAVSIGGSLMGLLGMLIFIPLISVIYTLLREEVYKQLEKRKIKAVTGDAIIEFEDEEQIEKS